MKKMKKIKPVIQLDQYGCTIACLSMITEISYFGIRDILHQEIDRLSKHVPPRSIGVDCETMLAALKEIFYIPCRFVQFSSLSMLKKHCILYTCPLSGHYYGHVHAVVFDAKSRKLIDPDEKITDLKDRNVVCCIELENDS